MLSNHYPLAFASKYSWIIAALVFLMGVTIRHYFNTIHARNKPPRWTWLATAALFATIMTLSIAPLFTQKTETITDGTDTSHLTGHAKRLANHPEFETAQDIVMGRCAMCHAEEPYFETETIRHIVSPPANIRLDTPVDIATHAKAIILQSALSHAMPPANVSYMEESERLFLLRWYSESRILETQ